MALILLVAIIVVGIAVLGERKRRKRD